MSNLEMAKAALRSNPNRTNREVSSEIGTGDGGRLVHKARHELESLGEIGVWRGYTARRDAEAISRIRDAIRTNHRRSDRVIAKEVGCSRDTVKRYRSELENIGDIPVWRPEANVHRHGRPMYTYVIKGVLSGRFKVGVSGDVGKRLANLQASSPDDLQIVCTISGAKWERLLHKELRQHHSHGEWFEQNDESVDVVNQMFLNAGMTSRLVPNW